MDKPLIELNQIDYHISYPKKSYLVTYFKALDRDGRAIWGIRMVDKESGYSEVLAPFVGYSPSQQFARYHLVGFRDRMKRDGKC